MLRWAAPLLLAALLMGHGVQAQVPWEPSCTGLPCPCWDSYPDGTCALCDPAAAMVNGKCVWCKDKLCELCGSSPSICMKCVALESDLDWNIQADHPVYKDPANGKCTVCTAHPRSTGCVACNGQGRCSACDEGFVLVNGTCKKCKGGPRCITCRKDNQQCATCAPGFGFASATNKTCVLCATEGCSTCPDSRTCTKCDEPMYLSRRNTCEQCTQPFCDVCNRDGQCVACSLVSDAEFGGYTLVGKTCELCDVANCQRCVDGKPGTCSKCHDGYFVADGGRSCRQCGIDCLTCKDAQTCTECSSLSVIGGKCTRCADPRCQDCAGNAAVCRSCEDERYIPDPTTKRCRLKTPSEQRVALPMPRPGVRSSRLKGGDARNTSAPTMGSAATSAAAAAAAASSRPQPAIIGGHAAPKNRYPWMAQLRFNDKQQMYQQFCGASLVHPQVLLTAAHCVVDTEGVGQWQPLPMALPQIRLGAYQMDIGQYQERYGKWVLPHPRYRVGRRDNDFALILMDKPAAAATPVARLPPATPRPAVVANTMLTAIGWGYIDDRATEPTTLMEVALPMVALPRCKAAYPDQTWQAQLCAGDPKKTDTCQGDSGGPLFLKGLNSTADMMVGVTSWGEGCAAGFPGVYSDVAYARGWIDANIQYLVSQEAAGRFPPAQPSK